MILVCIICGDRYEFKDIEPADRKSTKEGYCGRCTVGIKTGAYVVVKQSDVGDVKTVIMGSIGTRMEA